MGQREVSVRLTPPGCALTIAGCALPFAVFAVMGGPWAARVIVFLLTWVLVIAGLPLLVKRHLVTRPGPPDVSVAPGSETPGPDDPVHYIDWDDRWRGCTRIDAHPEHLYFWKADMPDGDTTITATGSQRCWGAGPQ